MPTFNESDQILDKMNTELKTVGRRDEPSVLRKRNFEGLSEDGWMLEVQNEIELRCPTMYKVLTTLLELSHNHERKLPTLCLIYGLIMFKRNHELSRIQRINTVLLAEGQASKKVS